MIQSIGRKQIGVVTVPGNIRGHIGHLDLPTGIILQGRGMLAKIDMSRDGRMPWSLSVI